MVDDTSPPAGGEPVEKDDEGRPYPCGAFVAGDSRWSCRLESDHAGDHEWVQHSASPLPSCPWEGPVRVAIDPVAESIGVVVAPDGSHISARIDVEAAHYLADLINGSPSVENASPDASGLGRSASAGGDSSEVEREALDIVAELCRVANLSGRSAEPDAQWAELSPASRARWRNAIRTAPLWEQLRAALRASQPTGITSKRVEPSPPCWKPLKCDCPICAPTGEREVPKVDGVPLLQWLGERLDVVTLTPESSPLAGLLVWAATVVSGGGEGPDGYGTFVIKQAARAIPRRPTGEVKSNGD